MRKFTVYVDQSGKIENGKMDTGLAFSQEGGKAEEISRTAVIRKQHKNKLKPKAVNALGSREKYRLKLFSLGLYLLTEKDAHKIRKIVIDKEYEGKNSQIKSYLYNFYNVKGVEERPEIETEEVHQLISGTPKSHELCYDARERNIQPDVEPQYKFLKAAMLPSAGKGRKTR